MKLDLCFGDEITPDPVHAELPPALGGFEPVRIAVYPWPTVVAEKLHAIARHGVFTTRLKDFFDIVLIARSVEMDGGDLSRAIRNTFLRWEDTPPSAASDVLVPTFAEERADDWTRFLRKKELSSPDMTHLSEVVQEISAFAEAPLQAASDGVDLESDWMPGQGWSDRPSGAFGMLRGPPGTSAGKEFH